MKDKKRKKGAKMNEAHIRHLRFADDIVLMSAGIHELKLMLQDINEKSREIELIPLNKTKLISTHSGDITINIIKKNLEQGLDVGLHEHQDKN